MRRRNGFTSTHPIEGTMREAELLYQAYPRHVAKAYAIKCIKRAIKLLSAERPDAFQYLMDRVKAFAMSPAGQAGVYCPHPSTWFNQGRWDDDDQEWYRREQRGRGGDIGLSPAASVIENLYAQRP